MAVVGFEGTNNRVFVFELMQPTGMYYGHYSYGHQGGVWTNNKMHDNVEYGFDPHDDSDDLISEWDRLLESQKECRRLGRMQTASSFYEASMKQTLGLGFS